MKTKCQFYYPDTKILTNVTGPVKIDHMSTNYTKLYCRYYLPFRMQYPIFISCRRKPINSAVVMKILLRQCKQLSYDRAKMKKLTIFLCSDGQFLLAHSQIFKQIDFVAALKRMTSCTIPTFFSSYSQVYSVAESNTRQCCDYIYQPELIT